MDHQAINLGMVDQEHLIHKQINHWDTLSCIMANDKKAPSTGDESEKLLSRVEDVSKAVHNAIEGNQVSDEDGRRDLDELSHVLDLIKGKLTLKPQGDGDGKKDDEELFPQSKREELDSLLDEINHELSQRKQPQPPESSEHDVQRKKMLSAATGCNPFKLRSSSSQQKSRQQGGQEEEKEEALSLKLLGRLAQHVLEPEQYYEWTTSYVDESRIYGWGEEADEVANALVGDEDGDFRAAAITGIHGSGKTALAQKVFIHDKAKDHFPIRLWVCVGPPDSEDKFNLLYRMLDNLGHDTNWIEDDVVDGAKVVKDQREAKLSKEEHDDLRNKAAAMVADKDKKTHDAVEDETERNYKQLLKEKVDNEPEVRASKIGVLLYILHATLSKTGYLIVFDDIRVYGDDGWYSNLTLPPPPSDREWSERLAYGLPKTGKHRSAVLVTCRKEDDARAMVRTGRVFRPPKLDTENGWKLFDREYKQAKEDYAKKNKDDAGKKDDHGEDLLLKELEEMKEAIVNKCLGLPVAIVEAAKGYACSGLQRLPSPEEANQPSEDKIRTTSNKDMQQTEDAMQAADDKPDPEQQVDGSTDE